MTDLTCPLCGLRVPLVARDAAVEFDDCPRCLARTAGAVSVNLAPKPVGQDARANTGVTTALRRLLPSAPHR